MEVDMSIDEVDYSVYRYSIRDTMTILLTSGAFLYMVGYLFFKDILISLCIMPLSFIHLRIKRGGAKIKRDMLISRQFCDALQFVSSSLSAGKTIDNAFRDAVKELEMLYGTQDEIIVRELIILVRKLAVNEPLTSALTDFAVRSGNSDILNFKDALRLSRMTGGNIVEVVNNAHTIMALKSESKNDIEMIVAEQKLNFKILMCIPFALIAFMSATCPGYMEPLYSNGGRVVSVIILFLVLLAWVAGNNILKVDF
jgi:tight adherence protein B